MNAARRTLTLAAIALLAQTSCAEIPTAPRPEVVLRGSVVAPDGAPVIGAEIAFRRLPSTPGEPPVTYTAYDGSFELPIVTGLYRIDIYPPDRAGIPVARVDRVDVGTATPRFDYRYSGLLVEGTVAGPPGSPTADVMNATIDFFGETSATNEYVDVATRFNGVKFRAFVPPGVYAVTVVPPSIVLGVPQRRFWDVNLVSDTTFVFSLSGHKVSGHAIRPDGLPMAGVTFYVQNSDVVSGINTAPDGSYTLYAPSGFYDTQTYPGIHDRYIMDRSFGHISVTGDLTLDLDFSGTWWSGTVRDAPAGNPIPGARVAIRYADGDGSADADTDADGKFLASVIKPGWHRVYVVAPGHQLSTLFPIFAGADSTFDLVAGPVASQSAVSAPSDRENRTAPALRFPTPALRAGRGAAE